MKSIAKYINTVTTQTRMVETARHCIGICTWHRCSSEVLASEVSVQSGIGLSLVCESKNVMLHTHPFYGPLDFVRDYLGEPVPER